MRTIIVEAYNPKWKNEFEKAKAFYGRILKGIDMSIEHVGSTSVEGLRAKPILDIDIVVKDKAMSSLVIERLEGAGYKHVGDYGVPGREVLHYEDENPNIEWMDHHLYVCIEGEENLVNHLMLRQHLRNNPEAVQAYSDLKVALAKEYPHDIDAYVEGKTSLITTFLKAEGMDLDALERITKINEQ